MRPAADDFAPRGAHSVRAARKVLCDGTLRNTLAAIELRSYAMHVSRPVLRWSRGPTRNDPAFFAAVQAALGKWTFMPLIRQKPARDKTTTLAYHGVTHQFSGEATALPFHQDSEFTFTQRDGIGFVSTLAPR